MRRRPIFIMLCLSLLYFIPGIPFFVKIVCAFLQAFYMPGFVFLLFFWDPRSPALDDLFVPPLISPIVFSLFIACAFAFTHSLGSSVVISTIVLYGLLFAAFVRTYRPRAGEEAETISPVVIIMSLFLCGILIIFYVLNPSLMTNSDALYHAPWVSQIVDRGIPPMEPRLPDATIRYPWFYHLFVAALVKLTGLAILPALSLTNIIIVFTFPYLIARIAARFTKNRTHLISAQAGAIAGLSVASWIIWPVSLLKALTGDVRGREEVARILSQIDFNSIHVVRFLTPPLSPTANPMLYRFLNASPFTYAIDLFLLCLLFALDRDLQKRAPLKAAFNVGVIMTGTFLMHIPTGATLILTAVGAGVFMLLRYVVLKGDRPPYFQTLVIPALALLTGLICLPYFRSLTGGDGGRIVIQNYVYFGLGILVTILTPLIGLVFIIKPLLKYLFGTERVELQVVSAWLIALFVINAFIDLPGNHEIILATLFLTVLIVPLSIVLVDWTVSVRRSRRVFAIVWISVLFLVPTFLTARGLLLDRPEDDAVRFELVRSPDRIRLYEWVSANTPSNSVIMERSTATYAPLFAHRHSFPFPLEFGQAVGYSPRTIARDNAVHDELFSAREASSASIDYVRNLGFDVYIVLWAEDLQARPYLDEKFRSLEPVLKQVYENPAGRIYSVQR